VVSVMDTELKPRLISVGTANPPSTYTQQDLLELFRCENKLIRRFFTNSHINKRHLVLPEPDEDGEMPFEDGEKLIDKHLKTSLSIGTEAMTKCLSNSAMTAEEIDYICAVTTTGFLAPGLSAYFTRDGGLRDNVHRVDVVGMGCNAGMNGLLQTTQYAANNPGNPAMMVSSEICSAAYVFDMTVRTGVVNSLFGDGSAAIVLLARDDLSFKDGPQIMGFESLIVPQALEEMRFDFVDGLFSFYLGRDIPYLIGDNIEKPINALLDRFGLKRRDIKHWLIHSGGKKVIDAIKYNLGITEHDVRHTRTILRDFGNLSSGAFLFSFQELTREKIAEEGDWGVTIAMGPGISIETGLIRW